MASMYIDIVPNRRSPPAILLRESIREGGRVRKRTIANLSALPIEQAQMIRRVLKGEKLGPLWPDRDRPFRGSERAIRISLISPVMEAFEPCGSPSRYTGGT